MTHTLPEFLLHWAERTPDASFVTEPDRGGAWTYGQVAGSVGRFRARLRRLGVARGDRVAILADNGCVWVVAYLGTLAHGAVAVPLNTRHASGDLDRVLDRVDPVGHRRRSPVPGAAVRSPPGPPHRVRRRGRDRPSRPGSGRFRGEAGGGRRPLLHVGHDGRAARRDDPQRVPGQERRDVRPHLSVRTRQRDGRRVSALPQHRLQRRPRPHAAGQWPRGRSATLRSRRRRLRPGGGPVHVPDRRADDLRPDAAPARGRLRRPRTRRRGSRTAARPCQVRWPRAWPRSFPALDSSTSTACRRRPP